MEEIAATQGLTVTNVGRMPSDDVEGQRVTPYDLESSFLSKNDLDERKRRSSRDDLSERLLSSRDIENGQSGCQTGQPDQKATTERQNNEREFDMKQGKLQSSNGFHRSCDIDALTASNDLDIEPDPDASESPFYDGGYGWVIVGACFLGQIMFPIGYSFGLFNIALLEYYDKTKAETALVGSLCYTFTAGSGLLASLLSNWLSHRVTVIIGSLLTAAGYLISAFSPSLPVLYLTYGVMIGTGVSLQSVPTNVMVNFYFDKRRNLATGIMASGSGLGSLILPLLIQFFIDKYTWRGAMIMLAGVSLHGCIAGALLRPNEKLKRLQSKTSEKVKIFDYTLLKKWSFFVILLLFVAEAIQTLTFFTMFPHRVVKYGFTQDQAALLLFLIGIGSTLSRVIGGVLMHFCKIDLSIAFGTVVAGMGVANLTVSFQHSHFWPLALVAVFFGAMLGVMAYLFPLYVYDLFGLRRVTSAFGCVVMGEALGGFVGPALAGYLYDKTGDYRIPFSIAFGAAVFSALLNTPLYLYRNRWRKGQRTITIS